MTNLQHVKDHCSELIEQRTRILDAMAGADTDRLDRLFIEAAALSVAIIFLTDHIKHAETNATEEVKI